VLRQAFYEAVQLHARRVSAFSQELCGPGTSDAPLAGHEEPATQFRTLLSAHFVSSAPPQFAGAQPQSVVAFRRCGERRIRIANQ